jgi:hypothetical protein
VPRRPRKRLPGFEKNLGSEVLAAERRREFGRTP